MPRALIATLYIVFCLTIFYPLANQAASDGKIISHIEIEGNRLVTDQEILDVINTYPGAQLDKDQIMMDLKHVFELGYFDRDSLEALPSQLADGTVVLKFVVKENPPITDLEIYGVSSLDQVNAYESFMPLVGKPENIQLITHKIQELESLYLSEGYIIARVKDIDIDSDGTLKIYVNEGLISDIIFTGNKKTKRSFLDHVTSNTKAGEPYNEKTFSKDFKRLNGTGYFSNVTRAVIPNEGDDSYTLEIKVQEKRTINVGLGGGMNSNAGLFGNVNLSAANVKGKGHTLNVNAMVGSGFGVNSTFNDNSSLFRRDNITQIGVNYSVPYFMDKQGRSISYRTNYFKGPNYLVDLSKQSTASLGTSVSQRLDNKTSLRVGTNYSVVDLDDRDRAEYLDIISGNISELDGVKESVARDEAKAIRKEQLEDGQLINLSANIVHADLDDARKPRDGWKTRLGVEPNLAIGDLSSFTKLNASVTRYIPAPKKSSFVFNLRAGHELLGDIPQFTQYRLGGMSGVRGYRQFSELGVGRNMLIGTAEFRTPIYNVMPPLKKFGFLKNLDVAAFFDAGVLGGNTRNNRVSERLSRAMSAGVGLRINLPLVGGLRVDFGFPLIEALTEDPNFFRINFGVSNRF